MEGYCSYAVRRFSQSTPYPASFAHLLIHWVMPLGAERVKILDVRENWRVTIVCACSRTDS